MLLVQLSDFHICCHGARVSGVVETDVMAEKAFKAVNRMHPRPDIMVLSGDLTDSGLDSEYDVLVELLRRYQCCPTYAIPGNHDRREGFLRNLRHLTNVADTSEFVQYVVDTPSVRLVMLDTVVPGGGYGRLGEKRLAWLERTLDAVRDKPTAIVMHHPPFDCGVPGMDRIKLENAAEFNALIGRYKQVRRILCGHVHRAVVCRIGYTIASIAPSVAHQVTLSLDPKAPLTFGLEPGAFEIHKISRDGDFVSHVAYVDEYPGPYSFVLSPDYPGQAQPG